MGSNGRTPERRQKRPSKEFPSIGCCGIDCGLCPRHHTAGSSRCPGCAGPGFFEKHPACGVLSCCAGRKRLEVCSQCDEFPCPRMKSWTNADSFVTHQRSRSNLDAVKADGLKAFLARQARRIRTLETMLAELDDGRSKGFYCLAAALLPLEVLEAALREVSRRAREGGLGSGDLAARAGIVRGVLMEAAARAGIELRLRGK
jgi:hypothetical protein